LSFARGKLAALIVGGCCLLVALPACGVGNLREHRSTSSGMAPLIPMNSNFFSRAPEKGQIPVRGDVVVFKSTTNDEVLLVKRVVAVQGEEVEIVSKELRINGVAIPEPYASHSDKRTMPSGPDVPPQVRLRDNLPPVRIGPGEVFVLGDNRDESVDSRFYGPIRIGAIVGYFAPRK
jgi:signal peptidase I